MTTRQLTEFGRKYMHLLGMPEWADKAEFRMVRGLKDCKGNPLDGQSWWFPETRHSFIRVRVGLTHDEAQESLIHEILHVRFEGHKPPVGDEGYDESYEYGLNSAAKAYWQAWKGE
jgi:hypothetical protein